MLTLIKDRVITPKRTKYKDRYFDYFEDDYKKLGKILTKDVYYYTKNDKNRFFMLHITKGEYTKRSPYLDDYIKEINKLNEA